MQEQAIFITIAITWKGFVEKLSQNCLFPLGNTSLPTLNFGSF
jgi:hypothetical protein